MDNRSHEEAEWDFDLLGPELRDLRDLDFDLNLTGFDDREIDDFLSDPDLDDRANIVPDLPAHLDCDPPSAPLRWSGEVAEVRFLLRARSAAVGTSVEGWLRVFCGPVVIAETTLVLDVVGDTTSVAASAPPAAPAAALAPSAAPPVTSATALSAAQTPAQIPAQTPAQTQSLSRYRRIFPSYSHADTEVVARFGDAARGESARGTRRTAFHDARAHRPEFHLELGHHRRPALSSGVQERLDRADLDAPRAGSDRHRLEFLDHQFHHQLAHSLLPRSSIVRSG